MKLAFSLWIFSTFVFTVWSLSMYNEYEEFLKHRKYFSYEEMSELLLKLSRNYPSITRLHTIGKSVEDRDLLALEISSDVGNRSLGKPMFKYVGNMHGDEPLGFQLLTFLCLYLVHNYGMNSRVTALLNSTDIFIMPSMNPDGYVASEEGRCDTRSGNVGRGNANGIDLNRDFPDQFNPDTEKSSFLHNRQKETLAMMTWIATQPFVLSANLHGGAVVVSYPFDDFDHTQEQYHLAQPQESRSPDDAVFKYLAASYADKHLTMKESRNRCRGETFQDGIVNGAHWYELKGGMQDYNYIHSNCFEITIELSCCKFPTASHLAQEWKNNKESFINYMEQTHIGVKGIVHDADDGSPIAGAAIIVDGINHIVRTSMRGEYWRLLTPGTYTVSVIAPGYNESEQKKVVVKNQKLKPAILHFALTKSPQSGNSQRESNYYNSDDYVGSSFN